MATVTRNKADEEITLQVSNTDCGTDFRFVLHGNHLVVEKRSSDRMYDGFEHWQPAPEWYDQLSQVEKLETFNHVLAEYRLRSLGEGDFKLAALGITESGDIYVSENTEQLSDNFSRQCAEQNMVTISTQRDVYRQIRNNLKDGGEGKDFKPSNPRYRDVYLMGGQLPQIPIACPCGNCTDLLSKVMNKDSNVWILPVSEPGNQHSSLRINDKADAADELAPGEAWKTTIAHFNKDRVIALDPDAAREQRAGYEQLLQEAEEWLGEKDIENDFNVKNASREDIVDALHAHVSVAFADHLDKAARLAGYKTGLAELDTEQRRALAEEAIHWVRAAAVQRGDGRWFIGVSAKSDVGKSLPPPEIMALGAAGAKLASQGILRMEVMECSPWQISNGAMRTSPKAALERAVKHECKTGEGLEFGFHGFAEWAALGLDFKFKPREVFPSYFTGKTPIRRESSVMPKADAPHDSRPHTQVRIAVKEDARVTKLPGWPGRVS